MVQLALCNALIIFRSALKPHLNQRMTFHSFQGENAAPTLKNRCAVIEICWTIGLIRRKILEEFTRRRVINVHKIKERSFSFPELRGLKMNSHCTCWVDLHIEKNSMQITSRIPHKRDVDVTIPLKWRLWNIERNVYSINRLCAESFRRRKMILFRWSAQLPGNNFAAQM